MNICILIGNSEKDSKIETLLRLLVKEFEVWEINIQYINLCDKYIGTCGKSSTCQSIDDIKDIYTEVLKSDCIVFATSTNSELYNAAMKAVIDRLLCMNKFSEDERELYRIWMNKFCAAISICSNKNKFNANMFEENVKKLAEHSNISYIGMLAVNDIDGASDFETDEVINSVKEFAVNIIMKVHSRMIGHIYKF